MKSKSSQIFGSSIENASLLQKFTVFFLLMSVIPVVIIYYFYMQVRSNGNFTITNLLTVNFGSWGFEVTDFQMALIFVVVGVLVGYFNMRLIIKQLISLTDANRRALENVLTTDKMKELSQEKNEIAVLARSFTVITERLEENVKSLELAKRTLHSVMSKVGQGITSMQNIDTFLQLILETMTDALNGKVGVLLLFTEKSNELKVKTIFGIDLKHADEIKIQIQEGTAFESVILKKKPLILTKLSSEISVSHDHKLLFEPPILCAPLVMRDKVLGIIAISGRNNGDFEGDEMNLLYNLASQTAVAIENSKLSQDIEATYFETISALALAVDAKDKYARGHLDRVANYCLMIANEMKLSDDEIKTLRDAARLHDLGKLGIPDEVLGKRGPLNDQEWMLMRKHPEIGESIIKPIRSLEHLCDIIRHHHEKIDGTGYPDRLKGNEITKLVRITTVADIYDALTTDRSYRRKMTRQEACDELRKMTESVDQEIVEIFVKTIERLEAADG
jgi:HD-GYP domain-containing protein (c-di-GMP phosphodiesterase class II)